MSYLSGSSPVTPAPSGPAMLRVRIGQEEAHYGGNLVAGAQLLRLFGDAVTEITIRDAQDEGLLAQYHDVRFLVPVRPGDYIEVRGHVVRQTRLRRVIELQAHKVIKATGQDGPSRATALDEPELVCTATATTVIPFHSKKPAAPTTVEAR